MMHEKTAATTTDPAIVAGLIPRFFLGAIFAIAAYDLISSPHGYTAAVGTFLQSSATANAPAWFASFVTLAVLPHLSAFATALVGAEIFVAFSLIFGMVTRVGAVVAIYLLANFMFAKGASIWTPQSPEAADMMLAVVVALTGPGRTLGFDGLLRR